eukprot:2514977-Amphidinium_carterae.1
MASSAKMCYFDDQVIDLCSASAQEPKQTPQKPPCIGASEEVCLAKHWGADSQRERHDAEMVVGLNRLLGNSSTQ